MTINQAFFEGIKKKKSLSQNANWRQQVQDGRQRSKLGNEEKTRVGHLEI